MVGAGGQPAGDREPAVREDGFPGHAAPQVLELVDAGGGRIHRHEGGVERAYRTTHDDVGRDPRLEQRLQRADLSGAQAAAAGEDDGLADLPGGPSLGRGGLTPSASPERENRHVVPPTVTPEAVHIGTKGPRRERLIPPRLAAHATRSHHPIRQRRRPARARRRPRRPAPDAGAGRRAARERQDPRPPRPPRRRAGTGRRARGATPPPPPPPGAGGAKAVDERLAGAVAAVPGEDR